MPDYAYVNGQFVPAAEARISVFDHGFLYGDGLFETMRAYNGRIFLLEEHLDRLIESAGKLGITVPLSKKEISEILTRLVSLNGDNLSVRLTLSRGTGPVGLDPALCPSPTIVITSGAASYNARLYLEGAAAIFVSTPRNLATAALPEVKSLNFLNNILARREVIEAGADEGFMLNYLGHVAEGTVSNVFMVKGRRLLTPAPETGLLKGVTRGKVMQIAVNEGLEVVEQALSKQDFYEADEIFYTNSGQELVPVTKLDSRPVGSGRPGPVTLGLLERYRALALAAG